MFLVVKFFISLRFKGKRTLEIPFPSHFLCKLFASFLLVFPHFAGEHILSLSKWNNAMEMAFLSLFQSIFHGSSSSDLQFGSLFEFVSCFKRTLKQILRQVSWISGCFYFMLSLLFVKRVSLSLMSSLRERKIHESRGKRGKSISRKFLPLPQLRLSWQPLFPVVLLQLYNDSSAESGLFSPESLFLWCQSLESSQERRGDSRDERDYDLNSSLNRLWGRHFSSSSRYHDDSVGSNWSQERQALSGIEYEMKSCI